MVSNLQTFQIKGGNTHNDDDFGMVYQELEEVKNPKFIEYNLSPVVDYGSNSGPSG